MVTKVAERISYLRKKSGITQKELGQKLGISNRAVSNWEKEISSPTIENIYKLSKIFGVSVDYFISDNDEKGSKGTKDTKDVNGTKDTKEETKKGMFSLKELYKTGRGPSSSHTMGPEKACVIFKNKNKDADFYKVVLYGSLAKTGKGHETDRVIKETMLPKKCIVEFDYTKTSLPHPNTMELFAYADKKLIDKTTVLSVGGGDIVIENEELAEKEIKYDLYTFCDIMQYCQKNELRLWEYALLKEDSDFISYMNEIWQDMKKSIKNGLADEGILPGGLNVAKKAKYLYNQQHLDESAETRENRVVCSYAFAVSEQNACGGRIVTAPTCGSSGVMPAVLYYQQQKRGYSDEEIVRALISAGVIGNLVKTNASISGAECGCQAEVGTACAMAAVALAELGGLNLEKIECAAEIAMEHHLGLTCDPICGLVQIPCIERNAVAAMRAINAVSLSSFLSGMRKISLDDVIRTMKETGLDLKARYRETSEGGLAKITI